MNNKELMNLAADNIRLLAVSMVEKPGLLHGIIHQDTHISG